MIFEALTMVIEGLLLTVCAVLAVSNAKLWIELKAMKASTHTLTYIDPLQQEFANKPGAKEEAKATADPLGNIALAGMGDDL